MIAFFIFPMLVVFAVICFRFHKTCEKYRSFIDALEENLDAEVSKGKQLEWDAACARRSILDAEELIAGAKSRMEVKQ